MIHSPHYLSLCATHNGGRYLHPCAPPASGGGGAYRATIEAYRKAFGWPLSPYARNTKAAPRNLKHGTLMVTPEPFNLTPAPLAPQPATFDLVHQI